MIQTIQNPVDTNDPLETDETVIHVPFWVVALVSALLLAVAFAVYYFLTGGNAN